MIRRTLSIFAAVAALGTPGAVLAQGAPAAAAAPASAQTVLNSALKKAKAQRKPVFLMFSASWCGWCKRLHAFMEQPAMRRMFADNYVIVTLDVLENGDKKQTLENPGGVRIMADLGGEKSGLPFYAILDANGRKLADSNAMPKNQNIGYPGSPEEIDAFGRLLKQTAPRLSETDRAALLSDLRKSAPKP